MTETNSNQSVQKVTAKIIMDLYKDGDYNRPFLAQLRASPKIDAPNAQVLWPELLAAIPRQMLSQDGTPTAEETAIYTALRLYALHQAGTEKSVFGLLYDDENKGERFFSTLRLLGVDPRAKKALETRVPQILSYDKVSYLLKLLPAFVSLIRSYDPERRVDYSRLAQDLYWFQKDRKQAIRVRFEWGEQYYRQRLDSKAKGSQTND